MQGTAVNVAFQTPIFASAQNVCMQTSRTFAPAMVTFPLFCLLLRWGLLGWPNARRKRKDANARLARICRVGPTQGANARMQTQGWPMVTFPLFCLLLRKVVSVGLAKRKAQTQGRKRKVGQDLSGWPNARRKRKDANARMAPSLRLHPCVCALRWANPTDPGQPCVCVLAFAPCVWPTQQTPPS